MEGKGSEEASILARILPYESSQADEVALTVAWYTREGDIHVDRQLLSPAPVDDDGRVDIDAAVVEEFNGGKGEDDRRSENSH